ncbi:MAG: hypothetical protein ACLTXT_03360 [Ruminococcus callidus]
MVVRALAQNPNVGFVQNGFVLDGKHMEINAKGDFATLPTVPGCRF